MSKQVNVVEDVSEIELAAIKRDRDRLAGLRAELQAQRLEPMRDNAP